MPRIEQLRLRTDYGRLMQVIAAFRVPTLQRDGVLTPGVSPWGANTGAPKRCSTNASARKIARPIGISPWDQRPSLCRSAEHDTKLFPREHTLRLGYFAGDPLDVSTESGTAESESESESEIANDHL